MENELEHGKSYTVEFLMEFLLQNAGQDISLVVLDNINLSSQPHDKKFVVHEIHKVAKPGKYKYMMIDSKNYSVHYYIKQLE